MLTILVAEDEEVIRETTVKYLSKALGFRNLSASSGNQAIQILDSEERVDVIVSDYKMADGSGGDLLDYLEKKDRFILFLFFTNTIKVPKSAENWFLGVVDKPDLAKVAETIRIGLCTATPNRTD